MNAIRRRLALAQAVTLALMLGACGSDPVKPDDPPTPPPPPPEVRTLLMEGSYSGLKDRVLLAVPFNTDAAGSIEAKVDWTFASNDVDIYLVRGSCTLEQFQTAACPFVVNSDRSTAKPEKITATSQTAGSYTLYIGNWGPAEESVSFQIFGITGGAASSASTIRSDRAVRAEDFVGIVSRP